MNNYLLVSFLVLIPCSAYGVDLPPHILGHFPVAVSAHGKMESYQVATDAILALAVASPRSTRYLSEVSYASFFSFGGSLTAAPCSLPRTRRRILCRVHSTRQVRSPQAASQ